MKSNESKIGLLAYQMWENAGQPSGRDLQFWLDAEAQLCNATKAAATPSVASVSNSKNHAIKELAQTQPAPVKKTRPESYPKVPKF